MRIIPLLISLSLCTVITSCGGDDKSDDANSSSPPSAATSESDIFSGEYAETQGLWVTRLHTQVQSAPSDTPLRIAEHNTTNTTVIDLTNMTFSDCEFNHNNPITSQDNLQTSADKIKAKLEQDFNEVFTSTIQVSGDSFYELKFEGAAGTKVELQNEKISDNTEFNSGSVSITWDGLFYEIEQPYDICSFHESGNNLQNENKTESFVFGVPYQETRLLVEVATTNLDLMPGTYDLRETDGIEIIIFMIDPITQPDDLPSKRVLVHIDKTKLNEGTLVLEQVTSSRFVGSISADTTGQGQIDIKFDIKIP